MVVQRLLAIPGLLVGAFIGAIAALIMVNVVGRYSGLFTFTWIEEAVSNLFIWLIFIGAAVAVDRNAHFRLALIDNYCGTRGAIVIRGIAQASIALMGLAFIIFGTDVCIRVSGQSTTSLGMPLAFVYSAIPISGFLCIVYAIRHIVAAAADYRAAA